MKLSVPGKLIITGEHAVVHGSPALAMAVDRYVTAEIEALERQQVELVIEHLGYQESFDVTQLQEIYQSVDQRYQAYLQGHTLIENVLPNVFVLPQYVVAMLFAHYPEYFSGVRICLTSTIDTGCGLGSSAAAILAILQVLNRYLKINLDDDVIFKLALQAEDRQHGKTSGLDLKVCMHGGMLLYQQGQCEPRERPRLSFYMVNTGRPETTTGECVDFVAPYFDSPATLAEFEKICLCLDQALQANDVASVKQLIRQNHRLLQKVQVVPEVISQFIANLEAIDAAAKVCGAGAVRGQSAGTVLVLSDQPDQLQQICQAYNFSCTRVQSAVEGVHLV